MTDSIRTNEVACPFCNETDFDLIGLKTHLANGDCDAWNYTEVRQRIYNVGHNIENGSET